MHDHKGGMMMLPALPPAKVLIADKAYESDALRAALDERGIAVCIPPRAQRRRPLPYDKNLSEQRNSG